MVRRQRTGQKVVSAEMPVPMTVPSGTGRDGSVTSDMTSGLASGNRLGSWKPWDGYVEQPG